MKRILIIALFLLIVSASFGQRERSITWLKSQDITNTRHFIWRGDTVDFSAFVDSIYVNYADTVSMLATQDWVDENGLLQSDSSVLYITLKQLKDSLAALPGGHDPVTLATSATTGGISLSSQEIGFRPANTSQSGYITSGDWNTFYEKLTFVSHDATLTGNGTSGSLLKVDTSTVALKSWANENLANENQLDWDSLSNKPTIPSIENDAYSASWDNDLDGASKNAIYDAIQTIGPGGATNLTYSAWPDSGRINSDTGTDATIPAGSTVNASLMLPEDKEYLDNIRDSIPDYETDPVFTAEESNIAKKDESNTFTVNTQTIQSLQPTVRLDETDAGSYWDMYGSNGNLLFRPETTGQGFSVLDSAGNYNFRLISNTGKLDISGIGSGGANGVSGFDWVTINQLIDTLNIARDTTDSLRVDVNTSLALDLQDVTDNDSMTTNGAAFGGNLTTTGFLGVGTNDPQRRFHVYSEHDTTDHIASFIQWLSPTPQNADEMHYQWEMANSVGESFEYARMSINAEDVTDGTEDGALLFEVAHSGILDVAMKLNTAEIVVNESGLDRDFRIEGNTKPNAFYLRGSDGKIGLGTNAPQSKIDALADGASTPDSAWYADATWGMTFADDSQSSLGVFSADASATQRSLMFFRRSTGTLAAPLAVASGDYLGSLISGGYDGDSFQAGATINFEVDGAVSNGNVPTSIIFETGDNYTDRTSRLTIGSDGNSVFTGKVTGGANATSGFDLVPYSQMSNNSFDLAINTIDYGEKDYGSSASATFPVSADSATVHVGTSTYTGNLTLRLDDLVSGDNGTIIITAGSGVDSIIVSAFSGVGVGTNYTEKNRTIASNINGEEVFVYYLAVGTDVYLWQNLEGGLGSGSSVALGDDLFISTMNYGAKDYGSSVSSVFPISADSATIHLGESTYTGNLTVRLDDLVGGDNGTIIITAGANVDSIIVSAFSGVGTGTNFTENNRTIASNVNNEEVFIYYLAVGTEVYLWQDLAGGGSGIGTDDQTLSWNGGTGEISIENGNTVDIDGRYVRTEVDGSIENELLNVMYETQSPDGVFSYPHSSIAVNDTIFLGERKQNPNLIRFNDLDDLSDTTVQQISGVGLANAGLESVTKDPTSNTLYYATQNTSNSNLTIIEVNTNDLANYTIHNTSISTTYTPPIATDGTYIYTASAITDTATFYKIRLSDWAIVDSAGWSNGNSAHGIQINIARSEFYISTAGAATSYLAVVSTTDLSFDEVFLGGFVYRATDDLAYWDDGTTCKVFIAGESETSGYAGAVVETTNANAVTGIEMMRSYGIFVDGNLVYNCAQDGYVEVFSVHDVSRINKFILSSIIPNEFIFSSTGRTFLTNWGNSSSAYLREIYVPVKDNKGQSTATSSITDGNLAGDFSIWDGDSWEPTSELTYTASQFDITAATPNYLATFYNTDNTGNGVVISASQNADPALRVYDYNYANQLFRVNGGGGIYMNGLSAATTDTVLYINPSTGLITYGLKPAGGTGGDNVLVNSSAVVDPDFVSTGEISFTNSTNTITANIDANAVGSSEIAPSGVAAGTYTNATVQVDEDGRVITASNGTTGSTYTEGPLIRIDGDSISYNLLTGVPDATPANTDRIGLYDADTGLYSYMTALALSDYVNATAGSDNWGTQVVESNATLTGDGTSGSPLGVVGTLTDDQTAAEVSAADAGGYYSSTTVEATFQEIAIRDSVQETTTNTATLNFDANNGRNYYIEVSANTDFTLDLNNLRKGTSGNVTVTSSIAGEMSLTGYINLIANNAIYVSSNTLKLSGGIDIFSWYYDGTYLHWNGNLNVQ